ncbi:hypothetical protein WKV44_10385, partial [Spirochaetia bacterium 38H-sp]
KYVDPDGRWFGADDIITGPVDEVLVLGILGVLSLLGVKEAQDTLETVTEVFENGFNGIFTSKEETNDGPEITTDNPPIRGKPNSTTRQVDENGNPIKDRHYGPDGNADYDIDHTDHGNPTNHPDVPHKHDWDWTNPDSPVRGPGAPIEQ